MKYYKETIQTSPGHPSKYFQDTD